VDFDGKGAIFVEGDETVWAVRTVEVKSTVAPASHGRWHRRRKIRGLTLAECARLATAFSVTAISHFGHRLPSVEAVQSAREHVTLRELSKV
jgi:1-phosphofructokinase